MAEELRININVGGVSQAKKQVNSFKKTFRSGMKDLNKGVSGLSSKFTNLSVIGIGVFAGLGVQAVKTAAQMEQVEIGLEGILGSSKEAQRVMTRLKKEAKRTPFELKGLANFTQLMATATKDGDRAVDLILDMGDALAFAGKGEVELSRLVANMQQIQAVGKASLLDLKQFGFAGIPIFELLAKETGKTGQELSDFIRDGKVSFQLLEKTFKNSADEGGRFFGAMDRQSKTLSGTFSNLRDTIDIALTDIARDSGLFEMVKDGAEKLLILINENLPAIKQFGVALVQGFKEGAKEIWNFISPFLQWAKENPETIKNIIKLGTAVLALNAALKVTSFLFGDLFSIGKGLFKIVFPGLVSTMGSVTGAITGSGGLTGSLMSLASFLGPAGIIAIGAAGLAAAFATNFLGIRDTINKTIGSVRNLANEITKATGGTPPSQTAKKLKQQLVSKAAKKNPELVKTKGAALSKGISGAVSSFKNLFGFEAGGIVPGSSFSGDNQLIRANSGERVLTRQQDSMLMTLLRELAKSPRQQTVNVSGNNFGGDRGRGQQMNGFTDILLRAL